VNPGVELSRTPGFTFSDPNWDQNSATDPAAYAVSVARVFAPTQDQSFVTPRIRLGWQIDQATSLHAAVGQTLVTPPVGAVASNANSDLTFTSSGGLFGRDVSDGVASNLDLGVRRWFGAATSVDLSAYDNFNIPTYGYLFTNFTDPTNPGRQITINALRRAPDGYLRGIDAGVTHAFSNAVAASVSYGINVSGFFPGILHQHHAATGGIGTPRSAQRVGVRRLA
jgi:hypothetical protein